MSKVPAILRNKLLQVALGFAMGATTYVAVDQSAKPSQAVHLALVKGQWSAEAEIPVRVHEPLSVLDALELERSLHSWSLDASLQYLQKQGQGVAVLLNCGESAAQLLAQFEGSARPSQAPERGRMDLRTYGIGAQILRQCGVTSMVLLSNTERRLVGLDAYGLELVETRNITPSSP